MKDEEEISCIVRTSGRAHLMHGVFRRHSANTQHVFVDGLRAPFLAGLWYRTSTEGVCWIRGHVASESGEGQALLAAFLLVFGDGNADVIWSYP